MRSGFGLLVEGFSLGAVEYRIWVQRACPLLSIAMIRVAAVIIAIFLVSHGTNVQAQEVGVVRMWGDDTHAQSPNLDITTSGNGIEYHGGPVMLGPHDVYLIWYGNWTGNTSTAILPDFISGLNGSSYFNTNTTYGNNTTTIANTVTLAGQTFDHYSQTASLGSTGVRAVVNLALTSGALPFDSNGIYLVLTSPDVTEGQFCLQQPNVGYCGYHTHSLFGGSDIKFGFIGDPATQCPSTAALRCSMQGNSPNGNEGADAMASIIAHELNETVTDPDAATGWFHVSLTGEVGDLCNTTFINSFVTGNGSNANLTLGARNFFIQSNWVNAPPGFCAMGMPVLVAPSPGTTGIAMPVSLVWNQVNDKFTGYRVMVSPTLASLPTDHTAQTCNSPCFTGVVSPAVSVTGLNPLTRYFWQVKSFVASPVYDSAWSSGSFTTGPRLATPVINSPQIVGSTQSPQAQFSWSQVANNTGYRLMLATSASALQRDPDIPTCIPDDTACINIPISTNVTSLTTAPGTLQPGTTYFFQIHTRASGSFSASFWSTVSSFTTPTTVFSLSVTKQGIGSGTVTSNDGSINCGATCLANFNSGTVVTLTATPAGGSTFAGWGGACGGTLTCTVTMNAAQTVFATFTQQVSTFSLSVSKQGTGTGTVTSNDGSINCGTTCLANFNSGTVVTLTATPIGGSTFAGWSGACSGTLTCSVTMNAVQTVTATFTQQIQTFALSITKQGTGAGTVTSNDGFINCGATCFANYNSGTVVTLTATPAGGSIFTGWGGACSGTLTCSVTMNAAQTVTATFTQQAQTFALSITKQGTGTGVVTSNVGSINCGATCLANFNSGTVVTLTATPAGGSTFAGWGGACSGTLTCSVTMNATQTVTATFNQQGANLGLRFVPVTPCRVADTRNPVGPFGGPFLSSQTFRAFGIPNSACNIPVTAQAYSVNLTVVPHVPLGFLTTYPCGQPLPLASTLNSSDGRVKAAAAIVPAGTNGNLCVFVTNDTELVIDINGYFVPATDATALAFYPVTPCRLVDTRTPNGALGSPSLAGGATRDFPILSSFCNVPAAAQSYSLNFTVVPQSSLGFLTTWPTGKAQPLVSTLNAPTGAVTANAAIVPAGTNGNLSVFVTHNTDLVVDIDGYFASPGAGGLSLFPLTPCRGLDTRNPSGAPPFSGRIDVDFVIGPCAVPPAARAYAVNATVVPQSPLGFLTMWPQGSAQPLVSSLNASDGSITSNMALVTGTNGSISAFASNPTHLILDISGYFAP